MATIVKRGDKWQAVVRVKTFPSKSKTFMTKAQAENWARKIEVGIMDGVAGLISAQITVRELLERHRDEVLPYTKSEKSGEKYVRMFLKAKWVDMACDKLDPEYLRQWRDKRVKEVATGTCQRELAALSGIFSRAIKEGWIKIPISPVRLIQLPPAGASRTRVLKDEEFLAIVGAMPANKPEDAYDYIRYAAWFALETGLRFGEIMQLTWSDIDVANRTVHVRNEWTPDNKGGKSTKNSHSREVPLSSKAALLLNSLSAWHEDAPMESRLFAAHEVGTYEAAWRKLRNDAGYRDDITFHDLRRTALTRMAKIYSVMDLAKISGHRTINVLVNTYYSVTGRELAEKLS